MAAFPVQRGSTSHECKRSSDASRRRHHGSRTESQHRRTQSEHKYTNSYPQHNTHPPPLMQLPQNQWCPSPISIPGPSHKPAPSPSPSFHNAPFEQSAHFEHTGVMAGITMERTPSGNSIMSDTPPIHYQTSNSRHHDPHTLTLADSEAARRVETHFHSLQSNSKRLSSSHRNHERILKKLIRRSDPFDDSSLDDHALAGILTTADTLFFNNTLSSRVQWEWSSGPRYHAELIGTTALRRCVDRPGFETLIVLSEPILKDQVFDRRLLLSTFLHELIHCYLFICCGFEARVKGGHTEGFLRIARVIDEWVGEGFLCLCRVKADLESFRKEEFRDWGRDRGWEVQRRRREIEGLGEECVRCERSPRRDGGGYI